MLTYKDRLKILRQTKIEHTLAKKAQNGYVDMDDYGTVPLPDGYHVDLLNSFIILFPKNIHNMFFEQPNDIPCQSLY